MPPTFSADPRVLILHAYSRTNAGDGLLVDLALGTLSRALGAFEYHVVASDAASFDDPHYVQWRSALRSGRGVSRRVSMLATGVLGPVRTIDRLAEHADLIVAVGGAYLRGGSRNESLKSWGAHAGQLRIAARHGAKSVYLPQSIGPYRGRYRRATEILLAKLSRVYARDDRTAVELGHLRNTVRVPDMAILEWARTFETAAPAPSGRPVFVPRELDNPRRYYDLLGEVAESRAFDWAVQASGGGNNDYPVATRYAGYRPPRLSEIFAQHAPRVVVSTRLHGSLSSLIAGYPTVHLTYERKGWSAFADLGLGDFVLSARDATIDQVHHRVDAIHADPEAYWATLAARADSIRQAGLLLEEDLRERAGRADEARTR